MKRSIVRHFSLIELLVVIAIILILAGLSIPALRSARTHAKKVQCLANQKNLGVYVHQYALNNNQSIGALADWKTWYKNLLMSEDGFLPSDQRKGKEDDYLIEDPGLTIRSKILNSKGLAMTRVFKCPADTTEGTASYARNDPHNPSDPDVNNDSTSHGGTLKWSNRGQSPNLKPRLVATRLNLIRAPSDLILITDRWDHSHQPGQSCNGTGKSGTARDGSPYSGRSQSENDTTNVFHLRRENDKGIGDGHVATAQRHKGDAPILFVDGHVVTRDYLQTIPSGYYNPNDERVGLGDFMWTGKAIGNWSDDEYAKKKKKGK